MGLPDVTVEVAFSTNPAATPSWTDISSYVRGFSTHRGRQHELDRPSAGTAQIVLDNRDQRFDPNNTSSPWNGAFLDLPGANGDYASVPDHADFDVTDTLDLRVRVALDDWTPSTFQVFIAKRTAGNAASTDYVFYINTNGTLAFGWSDGVSLPVKSSTVATGFTDGTVHWVRATLDPDDGAGNYVIKFYTSDEGTTWTQLGTTVTAAGASSIQNGAFPVQVGAQYVAGELPVYGRIWRAQVYDGIDGTLVLDADFTGQTAGATSFTDGTGNHTVTVNGNAEIIRNDLLPMRRIRIRATWNAATYDVFNGYVESWPQQYVNPTDAYVTVNCVDGFKVLNLQAVTATYSQEASGTRIGNVLDDVGWPAADRDIDAGQSTIAADTLTDTYALAHIADVERAELGLFFIAADGNATFVDRHAFVQAALDSQDTWVDADSGSGFVYADVTVLYDDTDIWNDVRVSRDGGGTVTVTDATSQARYYPRTFTEHQNLIVADDSTLTDHANALLTRYAEPALRIVNLTILPQTDDSWARLLSYDLATKVRVKRDPPGGGDTIDQTSWIEGISHRARPGQWQTVLNLSPVDRTTDYWVLGTSELDSTTRLGF